MKSTIIKIALSIVVILSSFSLQSCKKEAAEIAPVNRSIIGKWKGISFQKTLEREFVKGINENEGTGTLVTTSIENPSDTRTTTFTWKTSGVTITFNDANEFELFEISSDGKKLSFFKRTNGTKTIEMDRIN